MLKDWFAQIGLRLIDFKLEFGFDKDGKIILADEFSPDNCRLWDAEGHHMDKDVFRRDLGSLTDVYQVVLEKLQGLEVIFLKRKTFVFQVKGLRLKRSTRPFHSVVTLVA